MRKVKTFIFHMFWFTFLEGQAHVIVNNVNNFSISLIIGTGVHVFKNHFMSTHLQQKLALVTSQIHAPASWVSVYDGINHLDMYIKKQAAWKMPFLSFLNDISLKQKKFVLQMCIIYRDGSRTPAASNTLLWQELTGSSRYICCQKKLHLGCCRSSRAGAMSGYSYSYIKCVPSLFDCFFLRLGESCSHIGAILFKIEAAVRLGYNKQASTDVTCKWNNNFVKKLKGRK